MNIDNHYYGTYYIARQAGWNDDDARKIAWAAQTVDELYFHVLKEVYDSCENDDKEKMARVVTLVLATDLDIKNPNYSVEKKYIDMGSNSDLFTNAYRRFLMYSWMPFHFLPEIPSEIKNVPSIETNEIYAQYDDECKNHFKQYESIYKQDYKLICKKTSQLCLKMIEDTKNVYVKVMEKIKTLSLNIDYESILNMNVKMAEFCREKDEALYRIGICMHVLADTWSHQNFCGNGDLFVNSGKIEGDDFCNLDKGVIFVGNVEKKVKDDSAFSSVWGGHGTVGHNPDVPSRFYFYRPSYFENFFYVDNGDRFLKAFYQMYSALSFICNESCDKNSFENDFKKENYESFKEKISCFSFEQDKKNIPDKLYTVYDILSFIFIRTDETKEECSECEIWKNLKGGPSDISFDELPEYLLKEGKNDYERLKMFLRPAKEHRDFIIRQIFGSNDSLFAENAEDEIKKVENVISALLNNKNISDYEKEDVYYKPRTRIKDAIKNAFEHVSKQMSNVRPSSLLNDGLPPFASNESLSGSSIENKVPSPKSDSNGDDGKSVNLAALEVYIDKKAFRHDVGWEFS